MWAAMHGIHVCMWGNKYIIHMNVSIYVFMCMDISYINVDMYVYG